MSIGRQMDKAVVVPIHKGILLSYKKNTFEPVLMRWVSLELIIQSEISQKEKDKYCIVTHTCEIWKDSTNDPMRRAAKETKTYRTDFWTKWKKVRVG